jgi:uncharacterized protein
MVHARALRAAIVGLLLVVSGLLGGCATLEEKQSNWIFRPTREAWRGMTDVTDGMEERWIEFQSEVTQQPTRLHALWLPQANADAPVLLFLHGARWDLRGSAHRMRRMHQLGFAVLGLDYRGFGKSSDDLPSEAKAYEDVSQAWAWMRREHGQAKRYIFGHSLGGALAIYLASEVQDEAGLIVEGTFTSVPDVLSTLRWGFLPLGGLVTQRFESAKRIAQVGSPVLVIHGTADSVIPLKLGQRLYELAQGPKRLVVVQDGTHHNTNALGQSQYRQAVAELFGITESPAVATNPGPRASP